MSRLNGIKSLTIEDKLHASEARRTAKERISDKIISWRAINFKAISFINWICLYMKRRNAMKQLAKRLQLFYCICALMTLLLSCPIDISSTIFTLISNFLFACFYQSNWISFEQIKLAINRLTLYNLLFHMFIFLFTSFLLSTPFAPFFLTRSSIKRVNTVAAASLAGVV